MLWAVLICLALTVNISEWTRNCSLLCKPVCCGNYCEQWALPALCLSWEVTEFLPEPLCRNLSLSSALRDGKCGQSADVLLLFVCSCSVFSYTWDWNLFFWHWPYRINIDSRAECPTYIFPIWQPTEMHKHSVSSFKEAEWEFCDSFFHLQSKLHY